MKTTIIALLLLPALAFSQARKINIDHHIKARNSAYTSMIVAASGSVLALGVLATDETNIAPAAGIMTVAGIASTFFYLKAWHHVGEAGRQRTAYVGIRKDGLALTLKF